ncbi:MAG: ANTAR domain-containing protein [Geodermatophilaceae bacterium]
MTLGQRLADIATIGMLQERAVQEKHVLAEQLQGALNSRVLLEQAKGMLVAERLGLEMAPAFSLMRAHARRTGTTLQSVASQVIDDTLDATTLQSS